MILSAIRVAVGSAAICLAMIAAAAAEPIAVTVTNQSEPVLCAEKDNVAIAFQSDRIKRFRIEAAHPAYLNALERDSFEADWADCDMTDDPAFKSDVTKPTRKTLFETPDFWVVGWTFPTFWRPSKATVSIGDQVFEGLHLVQVWTIRPMGGEEVLVFYPQDGYWRLRPKAPAGRDLTAFGSSVLIGPVTNAGRPIVDLADVDIDPKTRAFTLTFRAGGRAVVTTSQLTDQRHVLDVAFDGVDLTTAPFAMVRSMYVTEFNNDAAAVALKSADGKSWQEAPVMAFKSGDATSAWIGRTKISRHNSSSPDHVLSGFEAQR
jgi:hypothetical protein